MDAKSVNAEDIRPRPHSEWRVVGVDPAPRNPSTICYLKGKKLFFRKLKAHELLKLMNELKEQKNIVITWDAPLTGPPLLKHGKEEHKECYFYYRCIERYFGQNGGFKTPKGISTLGYAGCPHWAITKAATGLPLVGPFCPKPEELPFHHIESSKVALSKDRPNIIEVHPALAMFLWLQTRENCAEENWTYKGSGGTADKIRCRRNKFYEQLKQKLGGLLESISLPKEIGNADELDAFIAWTLGYSYAQGRKDLVDVLGDRCKGSMLLPAVELNEVPLEDGFDEWLRRKKATCLENNVTSSP